MKLSIIIPVFNEKNTISKILDRVKSINLNQIISKEIIIVDDCSTDGTKRISKRVGNQRKQKYQN